MITIASGAGRYGVTVGTLSVLSLEPALVAFALKADSGLLPHLHTGRAAGINVLADGQSDVALRFATASIDRFNSTRWCEEHSLPRIDDGVAWLAVRVEGRIVLGDHTLVTARVEHGETSRLTPLLHWRRDFHSPNPIASAI
ncbi:flavin reductase [Sinorhizobium meliloti]|nr:flavin reductase [Sinorhizobium meliloti]MCK3791682.1 flavin reductase [Sinorhizobium meliloti]MCK3797187.1 flavin reductase [Sinorhizobium meliloti]MDW9825971.1 flavin reductase [Sinorhizobium meliloti]